VIIFLQAEKSRKSSGAEKGLSKQVLIRREKPEHRAFHKNKLNK